MPAARLQAQRRSHADTFSLLREIGVSAAEMVKFEKSMKARIEKDRKAGKLHEFTGDIEALVMCKASLSRR